MKYQPFYSLCFCLVSIIPPNRAYPDVGTISEMRYAYTKILIVTCYLLLQGQKCRCASVVLSLFLRSRDYRMNGLITDL